MQERDTHDDDLHVDEELLEDLEERPEKAEDVKGGAAKQASSLFGPCH
jgi:hypothetical protein